MKLERPAPTDRSAWVGQDGELVYRLNVPWEPGVGALWRVRFADGTDEIFSEAEVVVLDGAGRDLGSEIDELKETWGVAPRQVSRPFRKRAGALAGRAVLAVLALCAAGILLVWVGLSEEQLWVSGLGGALILLGVGAAAALVS